jgi:hypothetical protein
MPEGPYHLLVESGDGTGARPERPVPGWIEGAYSGWQLGTGFVTVGALTRCQHRTGGPGTSGILAIRSACIVRVRVAPVWDR